MRGRPSARAGFARRAGWRAPSPRAPRSPWPARCTRRATARASCCSRPSSRRRCWRGAGRGWDLAALRPDPRRPRPHAGTGPHGGAGSGRGRRGRGPGTRAGAAAARLAAAGRRPANAARTFRQSRRDGAGPPPRAVRAGVRGAAGAPGAAGSEPRPAWTLTAAQVAEARARAVAALPFQLTAAQVHAAHEIAADWPAAALTSWA